MMRICSLLLLIVLFSCKEEVEVLDIPMVRKEVVAVEMDSILEEVIPELIVIDTLEQQIIEAGLVDVQTLNPNILVELKYSTTDNFMGVNLYGDLRKAYLQEDIAQRLSKAQDELTSLDSNLHFLIYDAVRPVSVQWKMWKGLDTIPVNQRIKFVSNPRNGSIHNYGCAIDLTLCDSSGNALDMGAGYDDMRRIAYPRHEAEFLASGELTQEQYENRKLLRKAMKAGGFWVLQTEWWHFNGERRENAKKKYEQI